MLTLRGPGQGPFALDCEALAGARIVAADDTNLGVIASPYARDSVLNESGPFGSTYGTHSIWNPHGRYGSETSHLSAMNPHTRTPPSIMQDGRRIGLLTVNANLLDAVHPQALRSCTFD
jgi:hypothetical protein